MEYTDMHQWEPHAIDLLWYGEGGWQMHPDPDGIPDDYQVKVDYLQSYWQIPGGLPGTWPFFCGVTVHTGLPYDSDSKGLGTLYYIPQFQYLGL